MDSATNRAPSALRDTYRYWLPIPMRWMDTDGYGHVNNAQYYSYFDTLITTWLVQQGGVDPAADPAIGLCVESQCRYHAPLSFPGTVSAGLMVASVGRSSVRYEIALYPEAGREPAATGYFVHVYVDRLERNPVVIPESLRRRLDGLRAVDDPRE